MKKIIKIDKNDSYLVIIIKNKDKSIERYGKNLTTSDVSAITDYLKISNELLIKKNIRSKINEYIIKQHIKIGKLFDKMYRDDISKNEAGYSLEGILYDIFDMGFKSKSD